MQEVQTFRRLGVPDTTARTVWMLGFQRRRVRRCECETLLPKPGLLPHTSQTEATVRSIDRVGRVCRRLSERRYDADAERGSLRSIPERGVAARTARAHRPVRYRNVGGRFYAAKCDYAPRSADPAAGQEGE